ncbi:MAG: sugar phosphate isomerase/epimerase [Defluviitaleaceae bacterium]|nr:sugar phosphate isomerase/epimerase [Defluviitaleaceae bacterium]
MKIALQLYSLKNQCEKDLSATLAAIKSAGYDAVETYTLHDMTADELKALLTQHGLKTVSMHVGMEFYENHFEKVISDAKTLGAEFLTIPYSKLETAEKVEYFAALIRTHAKAVRDAGLKWLYHNHDHELKPLDNGKNFFDILLEGTDAGDINLQVDTHWVAHAGVKITDFISKYGNRISCFHLKDEAELAGGNINFAAVVSAAKVLGHKCLIVEQERFDKDPIECITLAIKNLKGIMEK